MVKFAIAVRELFGAITSQSILFVLEKGKIYSTVQNSVFNTHFYGSKNCYCKFLFVADLETYVPLEKKYI